MKEKPVPVTFTGEGCVHLQNCFVFRDGLAHKANVSIASAVSYTDDPHLFCISIAVPGSRKLTLELGIPFLEAMRLTRFAVMWDKSIMEYDTYKLGVVSRLFHNHVADLSAMQWSDAEIDAVRDLQIDNELQQEVQSDLLKIAEASLEKHDV